MSANNEKKAYIYQGNTLIIPDNAPDSLAQDELDLDFIGGAFDSFEERDIFSAPALDGGPPIGVIYLPAGALPPGWKALPIRQALLAATGGTMAESQGSTGRLLRSYHVALWRRDSRFCGSCGSRNGDALTGELARLCPACGRLEFPRISPAIIVVITNDKGQALLAHNKNFTSGLYSILAGFNEAGESLEATVAREVKEEVNLELKDIRYICSQPWPFPNSLMLGFTARHAGGELRPDGKEIEDVKWFSRDELPVLPGSASISRHLIELWRAGKL